MFDLFYNIITVLSFELYICRAPLFEVQTDKWECFRCVLWNPAHADCAVPQVFLLILILLLHVIVLVLFCYLIALDIVLPKW